MNDDWLDAFAPEDLDEPRYTQIDAAVERLPSPTNRRSRAWLAVPIAMAAAALLWLAPLGSSPSHVAPAHSPPIQVVDVGTTVEARRHAASPGERAVVAPNPIQRPVLVRDGATASAPAEHPVTTGRSEPPVVTEESPVAPRDARATQPKRPGLALRPGALAKVIDSTAVLSSGVLTYRHDDRHEPGVRRVRIANPPMVARPVGTAFSASTRDGYAAVQVTEGEVWVERLDGEAVFPLHPGDEVLVFEDRDGLAWLATGGVPLDEVVDLLPRARSRDGRVVMSMLASLRLASRESLEQATVPFVLGGGAMIALALTAHAAPTAPHELADAALEAAAVIRECRQAAERGGPCSDPTTLAEASVVQALAALVNDGELDRQASIDAWRLDPEVAGGWSELIGHPTGSASAWVAHAIEPSPPEATPTAAPSPPNEAVQPAPPEPRRWWSAAFSGNTRLFGQHSQELGGNSLRAEGLLVDNGFTARVDGVVGRTVLDLTIPIAAHTGMLAVPSKDTRFSVQHGRVGLSAGYTFARRIQVVVGPHLGSTGFGPRAMQRLVNDQGLQPDPAPWVVGGTLRGRARLGNRRVAGQFEVWNAYDVELGRSGYWNRTASESYGGTARESTVHRLRTGTRAEVQVRTASHVWLTVGLRTLGTTKLGAQGPQLLDELALEAGARWL